MIILYPILIVLLTIILWHRRHYYKLSWQLAGPIGLPILGNALSIINPRSEYLRKLIFLVVFSLFVERQGIFACSEIYFVLWVKIVEVTVLNVVKGISIKTSSTLKFTICFIRRAGILHLILFKSLFITQLIPDFLCKQSFSTERCALFPWWHLIEIWKSNATMVRTTNGSLCSRRRKCWNCA